MDGAEEQLRQLVQEACSAPPGSLRRQRSLTQIIRLTSSKLWKENTPYYSDALQQTWVYFCQNICESKTGECYNPDRSTIATWLNYYLRRRLQDFFIESQRQLALRVADPIQHLSLDEAGGDRVANLAAAPDVPPILQEVRAWAESDFSGELRNTHIAEHPEVNCQVLILRRLPPETSWKELAAEFGLSVSTLSSFYQRQCLSRLRKFGESEGYL
jgi:DNA-directed RNA polymerase specialized sigma24 family protein